MKTFFQERLSLMKIYYFCQGLIICNALEWTTHISVQNHLRQGMKIPDEVPPRFAQSSLLSGNTGSATEEFGQSLPNPHLATFVVMF